MKRMMMILALAAGVAACGDSTGTNGVGMVTAQSLQQQFALGEDIQVGLQSSNGAAFYVEECSIVANGQGFDGTQVSTTTTCNGATNPRTPLPGGSGVYNMEASRLPKAGTYRMVFQVFEGATGGQAITVTSNTFIYGTQ